MNTRINTHLIPLAALVGALTMAAAPATYAAAERSHTGPNGATREVERGDRDRSATTTGPEGKTFSRDKERENGDKTTTTTGPNGRTTTRDVDRDLEDGKTVTRTNGQGDTKTHNRDIDVRR